MQEDGAKENRAHTPGEAPDLPLCGWPHQLDVGIQRSATAFRLRLIMGERTASSTCNENGCQR